MGKLESLTIENKFYEEEFGCVIVNNTKFDITVNSVSIIDTETGDQIAKVIEYYVVHAEKSSNMDVVVNYKKFRNEYNVDQFLKMKFKVLTDFDTFISDTFRI